VFLQRIKKPQSIRFHPLWRGPNGPMAIFPAITVFITILEHHSNGRDASNSHIASPSRSSLLCYSAIPARFNFYKPSSCEVFTGTSCNLSNFAFFLLSFLSFFPVIRVSGFLFPLLFCCNLGLHPLPLFSFSLCLHQIFLFWLVKSFSHY
jgi:hypothetical protein